MSQVVGKITAKNVNTSNISVDDFSFVKDLNDVQNYINFIYYLSNK